MIKFLDAFKFVMTNLYIQYIHLKKTSFEKGSPFLHHI